MRLRRYYSEQFRLRWRGFSRLGIFPGGAQAFLQTFVELGEDDTFFSFLPLAHIFDQVVELMFIGLGAHIGYWRGDVKKLVDDVGVCKPTLFAGVPRIYDKIYNGAMGKFSKAPLSWLYNWAKGRKLYFMEEGMQSYKTASPMADGIVFKKVAKKLGGGEGPGPLGERGDHCALRERAAGRGVRSVARRRRRETTSATKRRVDACCYVYVQDADGRRAR